MKKTPQQIDAMREGGKILATIFKDLKKYVQPGMTEIDLNNWAKKEIISYGASPSYLEPVPNFPGVICISVNDELVHGVPTGRAFKKGDVASFDMVIGYDGMMVDSAFTMVVGTEPKGAAKHLLKVTEKSLYAGIESINGAGTKTGDIGAAIEKVLKAGKLGVVVELVGHGIGQAMHMPPNIPNFGKKGTGEVLQAGDTIAIEPMATLGKGFVKEDKDDGWTIFSADNTLSAHFEHTVLITPSGYEILTKLD